MVRILKDAKDLDTPSVFLTFSSRFYVKFLMFYKLKIPLYLCITLGKFKTFQEFYPASLASFKILIILIQVKKIYKATGFNR
jgi:hypothetical protein